MGNSMRKWARILPRERLRKGLRVIDIKDWIKVADGRVDS